MEEAGVQRVTNICTSPRRRADALGSGGFAACIGLSLWKMLPTPQPVTLSDAEKLRLTIY